MSKRKIYSQKSRGHYYDPNTGKWYKQGEGLDYGSRAGGSHAPVRYKDEEIKDAKTLAGLNQELKSLPNPNADEEAYEKAMDFWKDKGKSPAKATPYKTIGGSKPSSKETSMLRENAIKDFKSTSMPTRKASTTSKNAGRTDAGAYAFTRSADPRYSKNGMTGTIRNEKATRALTMANESMAKDAAKEKEGLDTMMNTRSMSRGADALSKTAASNRSTAASNMADKAFRDVTDDMEKPTLQNDPMGANFMGYGKAQATKYMNRTGDTKKATKRIAKYDKASENFTRKTAAVSTSNDGKGYDQDNIRESYAGMKGSDKRTVRKAANKVAKADYMMNSFGEKNAKASAKKEKKNDKIDKKVSKLERKTSNLKAKKYSRGGVVGGRKSKAMC